MINNYLRRKPKEKGRHWAARWWDSRNMSTKNLTFSLFWGFRLSHDYQLTCVCPLNRRYQNFKNMMRARGFGYNDFDNNYYSSYYSRLITFQTMII